MTGENTAAQHLLHITKVQEAFKCQRFYFETLIMNTDLVLVNTDCLFHIIRYSRGNERALSGQKVLLIWNRRVGERGSLVDFFLKEGVVVPHPQWRFREIRCDEVGIKEFNELFNSITRLKLGKPSVFFQYRRHVPLEAAAKTPN